MDGKLLHLGFRTPKVVAQHTVENSRERIGRHVWGQGLEVDFDRGGIVRVQCFEQPDELVAPVIPVGFLAQLEQLIVERQQFPERAPTSYTVSLFKKGMPKIAQKVGEEAVETIIDAVAGHRDTLPGEVADLLYHLLVLLVGAGIRLDEIIAVLQERHRIPSFRHLTGE